MVFNAEQEQMKLASEIIEEKFSLKSMLKIVQLLGFAA